MRPTAAITPLATPVVSFTKRNAPTPVKSTYTQILKSTAIIGGSSAINIVFGIVRSKAMALLLGPAGVGLMGLYYSISEVAQSLAGLGVQSSGVRQIAEAVASGDALRIARTAAVLRRISLLLGVAGALLLAALAVPVSRLTFGGAQEASGIVLLSFSVLFRLVSVGQGALIQGMRRISDLARMNVIAALFGTVVSIPLVYVYRERGVVPSLVTVSVLSLVTSWWYSRKIDVPVARLSVRDVICESRDLVKLGVAFMASGFLTMGAAYAIRIIVMRNAGFEAAGLYQAAWALGGLYVGFILQAMGADFYPRLTGVTHDHGETNRLVNEQAHISLLLAGPGVIATLTLAPVVLNVFYSSEFQSAVTLLRWICLGMLLRVVAWPMGFIVIARGAQQTFFWSEVAAAVVHVGLAWLLVPRLGVNGAGVAFFALYVWHSLLMYVLVRRMTGFGWSAPNLRLAGLLLPLAGFVFVAFHALPMRLALAFGVAATIGCGAYSLRRLVYLLPPSAIPEPIRLLLAKVGFRTQTA